MTWTSAIPVIEGEVASCSWCKIPLFRDGLPPVPIHNKRFHVVCARAYSRDFLARASGA
jgi:hypothetical protein